MIGDWWIWGIGWIVFFVIGMVLGAVAMEKNCRWLERIAGYSFCAGMLSGIIMTVVLVIKLFKFIF